MKANESGWTLAKQQQVKQEKQARGTWGVQPSVPARPGSSPGMNLGVGMPHRNRIRNWAACSLVYC